MKKKSEELYKKHRPTLLKNVVGQKSAIGQIKTWLEEESTPHAILFQGSTGCGKTTVARILANKLKCVGKDLKEINAASSRGIDDIRDIERKIRYAPMVDGGNKVYIIDEAHKLTSDAQNGFLKPLEEPPEYAYFMICSSMPGKIIATIQNRCTKLSFKELSDDEIRMVLRRVIDIENLSITDSVIKKIVEFSAGSARQSLVLLEQVMREKSEEAQLEAIQETTLDRKAKELCQVFFKKTPQWVDVCSLMRGLKDDHEQLRHAVLGYANVVALSGDHPNATRANIVISFFRDDWYACGRSGLTNACFETIRAISR